MIRTIAMLSMTMAGVSLAQAPATTRAPTYKANSLLGCAAGTKQVGAPTGGMSAMACMKFSTGGVRVFHGPMVSFYNSGKVEAVGQMEEGLRTGKWTFFLENGSFVGETEFAAGEYSGVRFEVLPNGKMKFEENWVNGKRQGPQKAFDVAGLATITEYKDDRPVSK